MTKNKMLWYMLIAVWLLALLFFVSQAISSWSAMLDSDRSTEPWHFWLALIAFVGTTLFVLVPVVVLIVYRKKIKANCMEIINKIVSDESIKKRNLTIWIVVFAISILFMFLNAVRVLYPEQTFNWLKIPGSIGAVLSAVVLIVAVLRTAAKK